MNTHTLNTRHECALCLEDKLMSEMIRDWLNKRPVYKCYTCMQDIYELEMDMAA